MSAKRMCRGCLYYEGPFNGAGKCGPGHVTGPIAGIRDSCDAWTDPRGKGAPHKKAAASGFFCSECDRTFGSEQGLRVHTGRVHGHALVTVGLAGAPPSPKEPPVVAPEPASESVQEFHGAPVEGRGEVDYCPRVTECNANPAYTYCGADPCKLVTSPVPSRPDPVDIESAIRTELIATNLRLMSAILAAENVPVTVRASIERSITRIKELIQ